MGDLILALIGASFFAFYIGLLVSAFIFIPYFTTLYLGGAPYTVVVNNWLFFLMVFAVLVFLKVYSYKTSKNFSVRTLFKLSLVAVIVAMFLYVLKFDAVVYSVIGAINHYFGAEKNVFVELAQNARYNEVVGNHWVYNTLITLIDKIIEFAKWSFGLVLGIDNTCFSPTVETLNILKIVQTVFEYIIFGAFSILVTLVFAVLLLIGLVIGVYTPYIVGVALADVFNVLVYKHRFKTEYRPTLSRLKPFSLFWRTKKK